MKEKQIEKLLTGVMNNFLKLISDNYIKDIIKNNSYITGGCIPSMLMDEFVNDYDIYFYNKDDADKVKKYFETIHTKNKEDKFHIKLITENAINLSDKIQLIIKFVGIPEEVTHKFDWQHIKSWYSCKEEKLHLTSDVYRLVVEKELVYTGSDYPLSSLMRLKKYIKKGWDVSNITILHIALDIVTSFNKIEAERQFEQVKYSKEKIGQEIVNMSQEEFNIDNIDELCQELNFVHKMNKINKQQMFNVDDIIYHMNGVDPIRIQEELVKKVGQYLSIEEIIKIMKGE